MRNKFSELVAQGVATFQYTPILSETPCNDPICREYNNIFGPAMDTHMSMLEDGSRIITGHRIDDDQEWTRFTCSTMWNGVDFIKSGYNTLNEFLGRFNLTFRKECLNGDIVMKIVHFQEPTEMEIAATNENVNESLNVFMVSNKKTNKSYIVIANNDEEAIKMVPDSSKEDLKSSKIKANVPRNIKSSIIIKDSDQVINESEIEQILNEAKSLKLDTFINFDLQSDIYNTLSDLAKEYDFHNKNFDEKDVKKALDWFMKNFFVDESLMESKDCIA